MSVSERMIATPVGRGPEEVNSFTAKDKRLNNNVLVVIKRRGKSQRHNLSLKSRDSLLYFMGCYV